MELPRRRPGTIASVSCILACTRLTASRQARSSSSRPWARATGARNAQLRRRLLPEYPDVTLYIEHLRSRIWNEPLEEVRLASPFFLRSVDVPIGATKGKRVVELRRLGKRIIFALDDDLFLVLHLMIAGRLRWRPRGTKPAGKIALATFDFPTGTLLVTEASSKKRASLHVVRGEDGLRAHDPGGLEVLDADLECFRDALVRESHTVKRALTDPHLFSGIGDAYSDEILHAARLSPVRLTRSLAEEEVQRLFDATQRTLLEWTERLRREAGKRFPEKVTAFHAGMAVHGRYGKPCPACGAPIARIAYADNETNYCPRCQTGGKLLADRVLSRLLREDWPRTLEEMEGLRRR
jgi:formamidopyrimidine-DNA glycosylase